LSLRGASDEAIPNTVGIASPSARNGRGLVIGIGNASRGDDGVGRMVARLLQLRMPADVRLIDRDGEATALLADLQSARCAWLVDAAQSGAPAGTIHRIDCAAGDAIAPRRDVSSHGFGVAEAIGLARALGVLPPHCIVYAIEAVDFAHGAAPSPAVTRAAHEVADRILAELATLPPP
jgi:hydrogenase maturation protease